MVEIVPGIGDDAEFPWSERMIEAKGQLRAADPAAQGEDADSVIAFVTHLDLPERASGRLPAPWQRSWRGPHSSSGRGSFRLLA